MSSSKKKNKRSKGSQKKDSNSKAGSPILKNFSLIVFGLLGGVTFYYQRSFLTFDPELSAGWITMMTVLSAGLGVFGATSFFRKNAFRIAGFAVGLALVHILINVLLAYGWVDHHPVAMFLANTLTFPIAIIWFFILKYQANSTDEVTNPKAYPLSELYRNPITKVGAIVALGVTAFLVFYRLGYFDIWEDENLVINAAIGVTEQGWSYFKEGYSRARFHTLIIAGFFEMFGVSEFIGRFPSAVFGVFFTLICLFVYARWYGLAWLAILLPIICLMNDRFLLLFRYMRMYALLIPLFLAGTYIIFRTIEIFQQPEIDTDRHKGQIKKWGMVLLSLCILLLLVHIHKLSIILLPVFGSYLLYQVGVHRTKQQMRLLWVVLAGVLVLLFLAFVLELEALKMFRTVAERISTPHNPLLAYYEYIFDNGLPRNATVMFLVAGLGLLFAKVSNRLKSLLVLNYLFVISATVLMVYLIADRGRDYRYVAHIVPFVVCSLLIVLYYVTRVFSSKIYPWGIVGLCLISTLHLKNDYKRIYERHPWSPRYSQVYATLTSNFKPGDALIVQNVKTYYLDPVALAGDNYIKIPKREGYTLKQFKSEVRSRGHGWVMWELHKSHHLSMDIRRFIYKRFKPYHNGNIDDLGVELFYFDETMVPPDQ